MLTVRDASVEDAVLLRGFIAELAEYEREPDQVRNTAEDLARDGFGDDPQFRALIAEWNAEPAGFAVYFPYYSTWRGRGMYLEDLFVRLEFRGRGLGKALLSGVARAAERDGRGFLRWAVLDWNQPAIDFYQSFGGKVLGDWRIVVLAGDDLHRLAQGSGDGRA